MKTTSRVFLVLLQLAIGWHFLFEGLWKFDSPKPWSSEAYLRESSGDLSPLFHKLAGDPLIERLTPAEETSASDSLVSRFPPALDKDWQFWFTRVREHYFLDDPRNDLKFAVAQAKMDQAKEQFVRWLTSDEKKDFSLVKKSSMKARDGVDTVAVVPESVEQRIADYKAKLEKAREIQARDMGRSWSTLFAHDSEVTKAWLAARRDADELRKGLQRDLDTRSNEMKESVLDAIDPIAPIGKATDPFLGPVDPTLPTTPLVKREPPVRREWDGPTPRDWPEQPVWRGWDVPTRRHWFICWAFIVVAAWMLVSFGRQTLAHFETWSRRQWLQWWLLFGALAIGAHFALGFPRMDDWPAATDSETVQAWLNADKRVWLDRTTWISLVLAGVFVLIALAASRLSRAKKPYHHGSIDWLLALLLLVAGLSLVATLALPFSVFWRDLTLLEWTDGLVTWGLLTVGACLLLGFCSRFAALSGALLLVLFFVAMPALPWLPAAPNSEGHYQYINKNIIELFALLVLAAMPTRRWGLDGVLRYLDPRQWPKRQAAVS